MTNNNSNPSSTPIKPSSSTTSKIRVVVRVRPFLNHESSSNTTTPCVSRLQNDNFDHVSVLLKDQLTSRSECYKLDGFFHQEDNNVGKIFDKEVKGLVSGIFSGCNATVFAYGATGSGKTFTMQGTDEQPGLMALAMSTVLSKCQATGKVALISYYEVYMDRCYDLLEFKAKEITVLDDKEGQIHLKGLSSVPVNSLSEFHEVFARGIQRRKVAHTGLNDVSSRSHAVLVISVAKHSKDGLQGVILGKMNLIDLAGNEDNKRSGNEGIRLQESAKINQSLFALSNVIYALNNNNPRVPYRESKLTRILQDSLGGRSHSLLVACLSPGDYQEAVNTVSLAARSRSISNVISSAKKHETPKVKIDMEAKLRVWLESKGKSKSSLKMEAFGSPFFLTPGHGSSMKKKVVWHSSVKDKGACHENSRIAHKKLFDNEVTSDYEKQEPVGKDKSEECILDDSSFVSTNCLPDELLEEDERSNNGANNSNHSPANRPKIISCQSPLRKALSPINLNITKMAIDEVSSRDNVLSALFEYDIPKTPFVVTREKPQDFKTPLDKFNVCSSNLKSHLAQEYIDLLNSATREELIELKGIGVKRAEYIMELRESSPLKSLSDLEKIGLSSKQVKHLFSKAAKGIFG